MTEQASLTNVLGSLVNDNDTLKHDNAELQNLLAESREETYRLQQEVAEHRVNPPSRAGGKCEYFPTPCFYSQSYKAGTPHLRPPAFSGSAPSSLLNEHTVRHIFFISPTFYVCVIPSCVPLVPAAQAWINDLVVLL